MKILKNVFELNKAVKNYKNVGFVPTMGGIHKGHESLIKISQKNNKETLVSIFINPTQFNQKKDFKNYPRNITKVYCSKRSKNIPDQRCAIASKR